MQKYDASFSNIVAPKPFSTITYFLTWILYWVHLVLWDIKKNFTLSVALVSFSPLLTMVVMGTFSNLLSSMFIVLGPFWWPWVPPHWPAIGVKAHLSRVIAYVMFLFCFHRAQYSFMSSWKERLPSWGYFEACVHQIRTILVVIHSSWPSLQSPLRHIQIFLAISLSISV